MNADVLLEECLEDKKSVKRTTLEDLKAEYEKIEKKYKATPRNIYIPGVGIDVNPKLSDFLEPLESLHGSARALSRSDHDEPAELAEEISRIIGAIIIHLKYL